MLRQILALPAVITGLALLAACDREPSTAPTPAGAAFSEVPAGTCVVTEPGDAGAGTLRAHLANTECSTITFGVDTVGLTGDRLFIGRSLSIRGPEPGGAVVQRTAGTGMILEIGIGHVVEISRLTISGGNAPEDHGGGIENSGILTLTQSTVSGNQAESGGGILNQGSGTLTLINSTISGNQAEYSGGIRNNGTLILIHSTVAGNRAIDGHGGGIENTTHGSLTLRSSLVAQNTATGPGPDVDNVGVLLATSSLIGSGNGHSIQNGVDGNLVGVSPEQLQLGELADNGGPSRTHALLPGSVALDHIAPGTHDCGEGITTDQRGVSRPQGSGCDIGAFELEPASGPAPSFGGFLPPISGSGVNVVKAGRAVAVNFSLGGDQGLDIFANGYPLSEQIACGQSDETSDIAGTGTAGKSSLSYDPETDSYTYVWKTEKSWAGTCRILTLQFFDDAEHTATFQFK